MTTVWIKTLICTVLFAGTTSVSIASSKHAHLRAGRRINVGRNLIALDHGDASGTIQVKDGKDYFILGPYDENYENGIDEVPVEVDETESGSLDQIKVVVMYQIRSDQSMCMQATHEGTLEKGAKLRVYPCDEANPLQHFVRYRGDDIRLDGTNWCVGYRGIRPNVGEDPLVLKDCDELLEEGYGWSYD